MSKVYENHLQMEELAQDNGWQEFQEQQEELTRQDFDMMIAFEQFLDEREEKAA